VFGVHAGERVALGDRGEWIDAVVVHKDEGRTDHCTLRGRDGKGISPSLSEGEGCDKWVSEGDDLRVRYDPEGVASPTVETETETEMDSDRGVLVALFVCAVVMGTWGALRQSRWDREYEG